MRGGGWTTDQIQTERITQDDVEGIAQTYVDSARYHHEIDPDLYQVPAVEDVAHDLASTWNAPDQATFVARIGGEIVGSADVRLLRLHSHSRMVAPRGVADVGIAVLGPYRRRGVGRRLMEAAEAWARSQGAEAMTLDCHAANAGAISFYQRLGYRTTGLLLRKPLEARDAQDKREPGHRAVTVAGPGTEKDFYCQQVLHGRLPVEKVLETERILAFHHTRPSYRVHLVVIPKTHVPSLVDLGGGGDDLLMELLSVVQRMAADVVREHGACRVITNLGRYQDSKHLHWHVISGERMR